MVKSQATRSRTENRKIARRILAEKLEMIEKGDQSRTALKAEIAKKKKASKSKKSKRKYRAMDEAKQGESAVEPDMELSSEPGVDGIGGEYEHGKHDGR